MTTHSLVKLSAADGSWAALLDQWQIDCEQFGEDFDQYAPSTVPVLSPLAEEPTKHAAVYGLSCDSGKFHAICQANSTYLPNYIGKVLRIRHLLLAPFYDFGEYTINDYSAVLASMFAHVVNLAKTDLPSRHVKFHLRSPADQQFFNEFQSVLSRLGIFTSIEMKGTWLYISL